MRSTLKNGMMSTENEMTTIDEVFSSSVPLKNCKNCEHNKEVPYPIPLPSFVKNRIDKNPFYFNYCCECSKLINDADMFTYCNHPCKKWKEKGN